jgi:energy-coupling factor transporter ATP-binding protein EcfA2
MFFEEIIMNRCNRTALNGKNSFTIRPTQKAQMVLGTNGSGKSSLIEIGFSPLPPEVSDFDDGGSLIQTVYHKGHRYRLENHLTGTKWSYAFFIDGGENLNKGRNVTAQLELCKHHLGWTKDLRDFLLGKLEFTKMTTSQRRDWIAKFSSVDFEYAFRLYKGFQKELAASKTVEKYLRDQMGFARKETIPLEDLEAMRKTALELRETLKLLMNEPKHFTGEEVSTKEQIQWLIDEVNRSTHEFAYSEYPDTLDANSVDELREMSANLLASINQLTGELKVNGEHLDKLRSRKMKADNLLSVPVDDLQGELTQLEAEITALPKSLTGLHDSLLIPADRPIAELRRIINEIPAVMASRSEVEEINEKVYAKKNRVDKIHGLLEDIDRQIMHIHKCAEVQCPSCNTLFKPGIEAGRLEELNTRYQNGHKLSEVEMTELNELNDKQATIRENLRLYNQLEELKIEYQGKYPGLFTYLEQSGWAKLGAGLAEKTSVYYRDEQIARKREKFNARIKEIEQVFATLREEAPELAGVRDAYIETEDEYNRIFNSIRDLKLRRIRVETVIRSHTEYSDRLNYCNETYAKLRQSLIDFANHRADTMVEGLIRKTLETLGVHEQAITENESHETVLKDLEIKHSKSLIQLEAAKCLVDAMCPKTGLIAEQISLQLTGIISGVNEMIQRVWGYPLYISAGIELDEELNYKFPLTVDTKQRPDIANGSGASLDIINEAFRLTSYYCMDLIDYPLYLDELGATFDEVHRQNLIPLMKDLIENERFSQVLIISHSLDGQTAFPNSETIILDDRNINYPHQYNRHVEFA